MTGEHAVGVLCAVLEVARNGYYKWRCATPSARQRQDARLTERIAAAHRKSRCNYGTPRLVADLRAEGLRISRRRCGRLMKALGVCGRKKARRQLLRQRQD